MKSTVVNPSLITDLAEITDPQKLLAEIFKLFGRRAAIGTSGQLTGVVLIDMAVSQGVKPRVFTVDTLRLFKETYELFDSLEKKYKLKIERFKPDPKSLEGMIKEHGEYLFFDSKEKQEFCCHLRKVEPNRRALDSLDVWITGLRADQSEERKETTRLSLIKHGEDKRTLLKVSPLVDWTEGQLREYVSEHHVPVHKLLDWEEKGWRYESLGCRICTTPIGPHEPRRAGRWRWFNQKDPSSKECGIHLDHQDDD